MRKVLVLIMFSAPVAFAFAAGLAADPVYMEVTGLAQGPILGSVTAKGFEGSIQVLELSHEVVSPRDAASGLPTGKRQHKALTATILLDRSSPMLIKALIDNESLTSVDLMLPEPGAKVSSAGGFRIRLTNAGISDVKTTFPDPASTRFGRAVLEVSFVYESIEWTWVREAISAQDDWETPGT